MHINKFINNSKQTIELCIMEYYDMSHCLDEFRYLFMLILK